MPSATHSAIIAASGSNQGGTAPTYSDTPYLYGDMYEDIPNSTPVYSFSDLGLSTSVTNLQTVVDALPSNGIIQLPGGGWTGTIPNFTHHGSNFGIYQSKLLGLLGVVSGGQIQTNIQVAGNIMTQAQLTTTANYVRNSGTCQIGAYHINNTSPHYVAGIHFMGADQQQVQNYTGNGPATHSGFSFNNAGSSSIFQNCLVEGFGRADDTTPPGEVGNWSEAHTVGFTVRRSEFDGRIPATAGSDPYGMLWRRGGGIQWNAATDFLVEDVYHHDDWTSGFTVSFTGTPTAATKESHDYVTRRLRVEHNSGHGTSTVTNQNSGAFRPINTEFNYGTIHHYQPYLNSDLFTAGQAYAHIKIWIYDSGNNWQADPTMQMYVHQPVWDTYSPNDNGCFSIYMAGLSTLTTANLPIVYLSSNESQPATAYKIQAGQTVPANVSTANNYYVLKYT